MKQADRLMREAVDKEVFPGGVLLVSKEDKIVFFEAYGYADIFSEKKMRGDTIFDLASLTKILAVTVSLMKLVADEKLTIETKLKNILPDFGDDDKGDITICQLLTHTSGLRDWRPYYLPLSLHPIEKRKSLLREFLVREIQTYIPETKMIYSDFGFMILEWVIGQISGRTLDCVCFG
ncbi:MAG: beta-lactamase family protein [Desulfobacteraceae bacterium]|nr:beta-lactamase family protein [Desulfobacteraceae bacterium]